VLDAQSDQPYHREGVVHGGVGHFPVQSSPLVAGLAVGQLFIFRSKKEDGRV